MWFKPKAFKVKLTGRAGLIYQEGGKTMNIDSEMLAGPDSDMVIYLDSISKWNPPHENELISVERKEQIKANLLKELSNIRIEWQ